MRNGSCRVSNTRIDRAGLVKGLVMMDKIDRAFGPGVGATQQPAAAELDDVATRYPSTKTFCVQVCVYRRCWSNDGIHFHGTTSRTDPVWRTSLVTED